MINTGETQTNAKSIFMADLVYEGNTPCTELQVATATAHPVPKSQTITGIDHWDLLLNSVQRSKEQNDQGKNTESLHLLKAMRAEAKQNCRASLTKL